MIPEMIIKNIFCQLFSFVSQPSVLIFMSHVAALSISLGNKISEVPTICNLGSVHYYFVAFSDQNNSQITKMVAGSPHTRRLPFLLALFVFSSFTHFFATTFCILLILGILFYCQNGFITHIKCHFLGFHGLPSSCVFGSK